MLITQKLIEVSREGPEESKNRATLLAKRSNSMWDILVATGVPIAGSHTNFQIRLISNGLYGPPKKEGNCVRGRRDLTGNPRVSVI